MIIPVILPLLEYQLQFWSPTSEEVQQNRVSSGEEKGNQKQELVSINGTTRTLQSEKAVTHRGNDSSNASSMERSSLSTAYFNARNTGCLMKTGSTSKNK